MTSQPTRRFPTPLKVHDTLSNKKQPLQLLEPGKCGVYCCGPTVYDMSHIGHARAAIVPDLLVRVLRDNGVEVKYVRNITDVDDKIIRRANETEVAPEEVATRYTEAYQADMHSLGNLTPDVEPKVTEHIAEILALIERLVANGLAYPLAGDVYYRVAHFGPYGQLSGRRLEDLQAGARVEVDRRKDNPMDFALWKAAKPGEPAWDSPWGPGRPGWHIECSAMSQKHLGTTFDVHLGGRDLIFPHHENELAQSQGANGEDTYARYWVHNGFVTFAGEKMSKSLGNFFTIREVTTLYHPEVLRCFLLAVHYRSPVNFDVEVTCPQCQVVLDQTQQEACECAACGYKTTPQELRRTVRFAGLEETDERLAYIYETLLAAEGFLARAKPVSTEGSVLPSVGEMLTRVCTAMHDDLNTAAAFAHLSEPLADINRIIASKNGVDKAERYRTIAKFRQDMRRVGRLLGMFEREPAEYLQSRRDLLARRIGLDVAHVEALLAERTHARTAKDWQHADAVREQLAALGVKIRDSTGESTWTL